jgi:hypothetical protein
VQPRRVFNIPNGVLTVKLKPDLLMLKPALRFPMRALGAPRCTPFLLTLNCGLRTETLLPFFFFAIL